MKGCGVSVVCGHGVNINCGDKYYSSVVFCEECKGVKNGKVFKEIRVIHECQIGKPNERPKRPNANTIKKIYIDGVYAGTCDDFIVEFKEVYI